jgi:hypothetical protein
MYLPTVKNSKIVERRRELLFFSYNKEKGISLA